MDFDAIYCASRSLSTGANPYDYALLHSCEHATRDWAPSNLVIPAPLPPYALALLVPIARLPYAQASFVWFVLLIASAVVVIWAIIELTALPLLAVGTPIAIAVLLQSLPTSAFAPIPIALLCAAAVALAHERWKLAALLLGLACIEPHLALPAFLAAFVLVREMRIPVAAAALVLFALSLLAGGAALNGQYFLQVLPAHAALELGSITQFSLSSMLHNFGVPDRTALAIGSSQYVLFVLLGIWLAARLRSAIPAAVVLAPMALAVTGGVYIHLSQVAALLPLAFVVAARSGSQLAWTGIALLAIPWNLLEAFTPDTVVVPQAADVVANALAGQSTAGTLSYLVNLLVYIGIACVFWSLAAHYARRPAITGT
jgi:hypothetical protein